MLLYAHTDTCSAELMSGPLSNWVDLFGIAKTGVAPTRYFETSRMGKARGRNLTKSV